MKTLPLFFLSISQLAAQTLTLSLSPAASTVQPGGSVVISVNYSATNASGLQWSVTLPAGVTAVPSIGTSGNTKTLTCTPNGAKCIIYGMNQVLMPAGQIARYTATFPIGSSGPKIFALTSPVAVAANASSIPVTAGPPVTVTVANLISSYDLTGNGVVDLQDVLAAVNQGIGTTACGSADVNADGKCDVVDVLFVVLKALGVI